MTDSCGSRSNNARATVNPPIPESNTPSGALFMEWNGDADAARKRADFEIRWEVAQMGRDVRLRAREQMIENPQHEPVLHFLPLETQVRRVDRLEVIRFLLRLERHHGGDPFPPHEPPHLATNTFSRPRSSSTVHSLTPGSRSSPSTCSTSGSSGERITSFAVLMSVTSR